MGYFDYHIFTHYTKTWHLHSDEEDSTSASVPRTSVRAQPGLPNGASANISPLR